MNLGTATIGGWRLGVGLNRVAVERELGHRVVFVGVHSIPAGAEMVKEIKSTYMRDHL